MPKEPKHLAAAQQQRKKIREKSNKYSPGKVMLQVLGTGAKGAPQTIHIFSDQSRYLINCGEGTQRLAHEHKIKLAKVEHIFFTRATWKNMGGLPGAALTMQDIGVPNITLHGPNGLDEIFKATRRFVVIKDMKIKMANCDENETFEDNVIKIKYVHLMSQKYFDLSEKFNSKLGVEDANDNFPTQRDGVNIRDKLPEKMRKIKFMSVAYIGQLQARAGPLCLEKCVQYGVPPGPLLGKLKSGEDVTLPNGNLVKASDVCEPDDPGPVFIVIECPSEDYLDSLLNNREFMKHQYYARRVEDLAYLVIHISPKNMIDHPKYKEFIERFSPTTQHLIVNEQNTCMGSLSVHRLQRKLNLLSDRIFPLLGDEGSKVASENDAEMPHLKKLKSEAGPSTEPTANVEVDPYIRPNTLYNHHLRPKKGTDKSMEVELTPYQFVRETMTIEDFPEILEHLRYQMKDRNDKLRYPKLLFLGTGSSIPNKTRNTSAILLEISNDSKILLDCGEGTYGQLVRFFGADKVDEILMEIVAVYISHLHADHHLGLIGLLQGRKDAFMKRNLPLEKLVLLAPIQINSWLKFYNTCFQKIEDNYDLMSNSDWDMNDFRVEHWLRMATLENLQISELLTCQVKHCPNAFGISITDRRGNKITYSGDTMPSDDLIKLGMRSDLLIHEATMEDELADEAVIKMHSTTSQAIEIGQKMKAGYVILTHFSQRYAKLPKFNENFTENVGIAFDNMQISFDDLSDLQFLYPALKLMFMDHYEEMEQKTMKRQFRIDREKGVERVEKRKN